MIELEKYKILLLVFCVNGSEYDVGSIKHVHFFDVVTNFS